LYVAHAYKYKQSHIICFEVQNSLIRLAIIHLTFFFRRHPVVPQIRARLLLVADSALVSPHANGFILWRETSRLCAVKADRADV
jgi:hypothetical protein